MRVDAQILPQEAEATAGVELRVRGLVQGVGFRPTVWRLARACGLSGEVLNDGEGVLIRAWGPSETLTRFEAALLGEPPPLARIDSVQRTILVQASPHLRPDGFRIVASQRGAITTGIVADAATCPACLAEVVDAANRRYRYPFTNCTHCGPRLSIVHGIPYDRASTSMVAFPMCPSCQAEYEDPTDRRFHAEPNACAHCGPRLWLEDARGVEIPPSLHEDAIAMAARLIGAGAIVAVKGIGGFHLACDAGNAEAVANLRARKRRYDKPFALMARDLSMVRGYARVNEAEARLLASSAAPIVVLERSAASLPLAPEVAPLQSSLGLMLPYTPLHHLLMRDLGRPIVLTSGNRSEEPQCIDNNEARDRLQGIADFWLLHDREIVNRLDDSVARCVDGAPSVLRRGRGYAPEPIVLPRDFEHAPRILAMGAELKNTFTLLRGSEAIVSQHIGDLEDTATHAGYRATMRLYRDLFAVSPELVAVDRHPNYLSTQWGRAIAGNENVPIVEVQHHHAHVVACLAEHGVPLCAPPALGIVLDGLGFGEDGELWGGEVLLADYRSFERLASFEPVPLLGGAKAMREPWRNTFAHLCQFVGWAEISDRYAGLDIVKRLAAKPVPQMQRMLETATNAPPSSSAGRLFDAVAAALGICPARTSYEGQAAIELEAMATRTMSEEGYPYDIRQGRLARLGWRPLWLALLADLAANTPLDVIAGRFHKGLISALATLSRTLAARCEATTVVLSGGVFQNRLLLEGVACDLRQAGMTVLTPRRVPANDGGISLGQAVIAAARAM